MDKWYTQHWGPHSTTFDDDERDWTGYDEPIMVNSTMLDSHGLVNLSWTYWYFPFAAFHIVCILCCLCNMHPGSHGGSSRHPPAWGPSMEPGYLFAWWQRDVLLWSVANSDIDASRQAALLLQQLRGGARELTRDLPIEVITNGALLNGQQVDPVTYIMNVLAERFGQLGEELRIHGL